MEFLGNVCRKEYNIFQYLHVGIPQNHVAYIGMLYVEMSMFFFAIIFPINNTSTWVGFLNRILTFYSKMEEENTL